MRPPQATKYLLDPLNAPAPSEETGPGTHYGSSFAPNTTQESSSQLSKENKNGPINVREAAYPSPPTSASPRQDRFPHRQEAFNGYGGGGGSRQSSGDRPSTEIPTSSLASTSEPPGGRVRGASLSSRFPGDTSHRPLDMIKRDTKMANRAPHLQKKHIVGSDSIDQLDNIGGKYHHDGPYDATLLARNTSYLNSPVEAVSGTNEEALKATPREKIVDSIQKHRPLDGVALTPPGMTDSMGRTYDYQEGADLMIEEGNFRRWPGVVGHVFGFVLQRLLISFQKYLPEDLKGKGEPSYSLEKALKEHKVHRRGLSDGNSGYEMTSQPVSSSNRERPSSNEQNYAQLEGENHSIRRSNTTGKKTANRLSKGLGSLRRNKKDV